MIYYEQNDYEFSLPWPPSVNAWKTPFKGRMILTKRGREYRKAVAEAMDGLKLSQERLEGDLSVSLVLNPPTLRRYDIDNFTKSLFDALTHCEFWGDDEQVVRLLIEKGEKKPPGNIKIKINKLWR